MSAFDRAWNGRLGGAFSAVIIVATAAANRLADKVATLLWKGNLGEFGSGSLIQRNVTIRMPGRVRVGERCAIGSGCTLSSEHLDGDLKICNDVIINPNVHLDFTGGLVIGNNAVLSEGVTIFTHSHGHDPRAKSVKTPLVIEESVWVGANVTICEGVRRIAAHTIIAAGAVVTKEVSSGGVYGGVPARLIKRNCS